MDFLIGTGSMDELHEPGHDDWHDLKAYLDADARLTQWPSPRNKKLLQYRALEYLATKFEFGRDYTEREVNELLNCWHTFADPALLRRELIVERHLDRVKDGTRYWRIEVRSFDGGQ
jgi:hypothetical protein